MDVACSILFSLEHGPVHQFGDLIDDDDDDDDENNEKRLCYYCEISVFNYIETDHDTRASNIENEIFSFPIAKPRVILYHGIFLVLNLNITCTEYTIKHQLKRRS